MNVKLAAKNCEVTGMRGFDGTWTYDEDTVLLIRGNPEPFHHRDKNSLSKIDEPMPNPLARQ